MGWGSLANTKERSPQALLSAGPDVGQVRKGKILKAISIKQQKLGQTIIQS